MHILHLWKEVIIDDSTVNGQSGRHFYSSLHWMEFTINEVIILSFPKQS